MHIFIAIITAIAALLFALNRLQDAGVNINSFNPFFWYRRHKWQQQLGTKPIHGLKEPLEAATVLLIGIALIEGEITREQKKELIDTFEKDLKVSPGAAKDLYVAMSHMIRDESNIVGEIKAILAPSMEQFTPDRTQSLLAMLQKIANSEGRPSSRQVEFIDEVKAVLLETAKPAQSSW